MPLSPNQKAMLDVALACDLKVSPPSEHGRIQARHLAIVAGADAAQYINEVETKIHTRRKFNPLKAMPHTRTAKAVAPRKHAVAPQPAINGAQAAWAFAALLALMVVGGWFAPYGFSFPAVCACMVVMMIIVSLGVTSRPLGMLINERNVMSLSRLQMCIWTILILGAYISYALHRMSNNEADALNITIDSSLWTLLGISTTSLVGAPLILSTKKNLEPAASVTQKVAPLVNESAETVNDNKQGTLYANSTMADARLSDLFEGDELANTTHLDLAKVQMFYFTIIAAVGFSFLVIKNLHDGDKEVLKSLPVLPTGLVAAFGISHAGYLVSKGINRTPTQPAQPVQN